MKIFKILFLLGFLSPLAGFAQQGDITEVDAKGTGLKHEDALHDALRNAVAQAAGVVLRSETKVENFVVVSDAVSTNTQGYITSYNEIKTVPLSDRVEVTIHAKVSLSPLKADINLLSKSIGGVRFLVMYDPHGVKKENRANYDFAVERINNYLSQKKYRYIEKSRFESLKNEASNIAEADQDSSNTMTYVQRLGIMSDAQFIIQISNVTLDSKTDGGWDTRTSSRITVEAKAYDNCTAEGLGTVLLESGWKNAADATSSMHSGVDEAVTNGFDKLLSTFTSYIGSWINNGTPYELRFYNSGTFRDFRELKTKLKEDPNFGGDFEIVNAENYTKLNCTFKRKPDELADKVLDYSDDVPTFKAKNMDVKFIYGRQISFAPHNVKVPGLPAVQPTTDNGTTGGGDDNSTKTITPTKSTSNTKQTTTQPPAAPKTTTSPTAPRNAPRAPLKKVKR